jgi:hypothetical protein
LLEVLDMLIEPESLYPADDLRRWQRIHARLRIVRFPPSTYLWRRYQPEASRFELAEKLGLVWDNNNSAPFDDMLISTDGPTLRDKMFDELRKQISKDIGVAIEKAPKQVGAA